MKFGRKVSDPPRPGQTATTSDRWIKYPKDGDTVLRFLEEMTDWTEYWEHFDKNKQKTYPCTNDRLTCPGCVAKTQDEEEAERENRKPRIWGASKKFLANALNEQGYVDLWKIPSQAVTQLQLYSNRFGTITDREYTITKFEQNDRVAYNVDRGDKDFIDLSMYRSRFQDHEDALQKSWIEAWGAPPTEKTVQQASWSGMDPADGKPKLSVIGTKEEIPSEPAGAAEPEQAEEAREIDEGDLRRMSPDELKALITECGLDVIDSEDSDELADYLMAKLGS